MIGLLILSLSVVLFTMGMLAGVGEYVHKEEVMELCLIILVVGLIGTALAGGYLAASKQEQITTEELKAQFAKERAEALQELKQKQGEQ